MAEFRESKQDLEYITNKSLTWLDIQEPNRQKLMKLTNYHFHELNIEDCLSKIQIPKLDHLC